MNDCVWMFVTPLQMFLSIVFAAVGVAGGLYSLCVAGVALRNGPYCQTTLGWNAPFSNGQVTLKLHFCSLNIKMSMLY